MKGMKKYTQSFGTTKQLAKEKMGKAENSTDSQETKELKEKLHLIKWSMKSMKYMGEEFILMQDKVSCLILMSSKTHIYDIQKESEKGVSLGEVMKTAGTGLLQGSAVGDSLLVTGDVTRETSSNLKASSTTANSQMVIPIAKIYKYVRCLCACRNLCGVFSWFEPFLTLPLLERK